MDIVATYLRELRDIHASGSAVRETSYYGPLASLLNSIGKSLKPRVRCVVNLQNRGAGIPDGGLFNADQLQRGEGEMLPGQLPSRGVLEVKGAGDDVVRIARGEQVARYLGTYGQVLVTNYRDFLLIGRDEAGHPQERERFTLASSEATFWTATRDPEALAEAQGERLVEYLKRVMLSNAPLSRPQDVAWFLASYARDARARIERADLPALLVLRRDLEQALGINFNEQRGDHFFRSTLIQTLFYGVFSAWVLWHHEQPERNDNFDWRLAQYYLHVPVLQALFSQISAPQRLRPLGLMEVLDWTGAALNRVSRDAFFTRFDTGQAVQYFYEPFLEAFDPQLRKDLGVWYTPPEVVRYMVARVNDPSFVVLRQHLVESFNSLSFDDLHGDSRETGKLTPDGKPDPSVFSTEFNREGIRVGTAVCLLVRNQQRRGPLQVRIRNFWGASKRADLVASLETTASSPKYQLVTPAADNRYSFYPSSVAPNYPHWPLLPSLFPMSFPGVTTSRDNDLVDFDRHDLRNRMKLYYDPKASVEELRKKVPVLMEETNHFESAKTQETLIRQGFQEGNIIRFYYRPFDVRWLYWEGQTRLLNRARPDYFPHVFPGNIWFSSGKHHRKLEFYQPQVTSLLADYHIVEQTSTCSLYGSQLTPCKSPFWMRGAQSAQILATQLLGISTS